MASRLGLIGDSGGRAQRSAPPSASVVGVSARMEEREGRRAFGFVGVVLQSLEDVGKGGLSRLRVGRSKLALLGSRLLGIEVNVRFEACIPRQERWW